MGPAVVMVAGRRHDAGRRRGRAGVRHSDGSAGRAVRVFRVVVTVAVQFSVTVYLCAVRRNDLYRVVTCVTALLIVIVHCGTYLHVFPERTGMSVRFVAARNPTVVRFVRRVHVRVFFPVRAVGEPPVASFVLAFERFLA